MEEPMSDPKPIEEIGSANPRISRVGALVASCAALVAASTAMLLRIFGLPHTFPGRFLALGTFLLFSGIALGVLGGSIEEVWGKKYGLGTDPLFAPIETFWKIVPLLMECAGALAGIGGIAFLGIGVWVVIFG